MSDPLKQLADLATLGVPVSKEEMYKRYGRSKPASDDNPTAGCVGPAELLGLLRGHADGDTPRGIVADWLEEHEDPRADAARGLRVDLEAVASGDFTDCPAGEECAAKNLRETLLWLFRPLLDATQLRSGVTVEELARTPQETWLAKVMVRQQYPWSTVGGHASPWQDEPDVPDDSLLNHYVIGLVSGLWAIDGRLYGQLDFDPSVEAYKLRRRRVSVKVREREREKVEVSSLRSAQPLRIDGMVKEWARVEEVVLLADPKEAVELWRM